MRAASVNLTSHLAGTIVTMAPCFKIVRFDDVEFYFTGHDRDLVIDGHIYRADLSFTATAADVKSGLSIDNSELTMPLASGGITKADVSIGLFYRATLDVFWVNWADLTMGKLYDATGWRLGKATLKENKVVFEVRSLSSFLTAPVLDLISPDCPYQFGLDDGMRNFCPANLDDYRELGTATAVDVTEPKRIFTDTARTEATDVFQNGVVTWWTGDNLGYSMEVQVYDPATDKITLFLPMPYEIQVDDLYEITYGCNKKFATCQAFGFQDDFGGEPNVPDQDTALQYQIK